MSLVNKNLSISAKTLSTVLHPSLVPAWIILTLTGCGVLLPGVTTRAKSWFLLVIILNTVVVPWICALLLDRLIIWHGKGKGELLRRELPSMVFLACYIVCIIMIRDVPLVYPIRKMLAAGVGCLLFGIGTVFFFKSSMHLTAMGAAVAYLGVAVSSGIAMLPLLYGAIALTALLASARLYSGVEDVRQSAVGFAGGLVVTFLVVFLI